MPNYSRYAIFEDGHIFDCKKHEYANTPTQEQVTLVSDDGESKRFVRKKIVFTAFKFDPGSNTIRHKDGDENNCAIDNLVFETRSETNKKCTSNYPAQANQLKYVRNCNGSARFQEISKEELLATTGWTQSEFEKNFGGRKELVFVMPNNLIVGKIYGKPFVSNEDMVKALAR